MKTVSPLRLDIMGPGHIFPHELWSLRVKVTNVSNAPVSFVLPMEGSWNQSRYPHLSGLVECEGRKRKLYWTSECGFNMSFISTREIITVEPHQERLITIDCPAFSEAWETFGDTGEYLFEKSGNYTFTLNYDMYAPDPRQWNPDQHRTTPGADELIKLERVPPVLLTAATTLTVQPVSANLLADIVIRALGPSSESKDLQRRYQEGFWSIDGVRRYEHFISFMVKIDRDKAQREGVRNISNLLPVGLVSGRYLLSPQAYAYVESAGHQRQLTALSAPHAAAFEDPGSAILFVWFPGQYQAPLQQWPDAAKQLELAP